MIGSQGAGKQLFVQGSSPFRYTVGAVQMTRRWQYLAGVRPRPKSGRSVKDCGKVGREGMKELGKQSPAEQELRDLILRFNPL